LIASKFARPPNAMNSGRTLHHVKLAAKLLLAVGLMSFLVWQAQSEEAFARIAQQPKRWELLIAGVMILTVVACMTFVRWHMLVRAIGLRFRLADAMRLGSLGYVLNLVSLGAVGGDLFKALFIAKEQPGRRTQAVSTVIVDRAIGLYSLLLVAAAAVWIADVRGRGGAAAVLCDATIISACIGTLAFALMFVPALSGEKMCGRIAKMRLVGGTLSRLLEAVGMYRARPGVILLAVLASLVIHTGLIVTVLCVAHGLTCALPGVGAHFVLVPLAMVAGAIPATPNGLGTFEAAMEFMYRLLSSGISVADGTGTIVALGYRLTTIAVAALMACKYLCLGSRVPRLPQSLAAERAE